MKSPATTRVGRHHPKALPGLLAACGLCLSAGLAAGEEGGTLRAGIARIDITPPKPVTMSGYESRKGLSQGVHDPLSARVVAFEEGGRRLVLVSLDNIGFYGGTQEPLRKAIVDACGLQPSELFLAAIHTHSAPSLTYDEAQGHPNNVEYTKALETQLVGVVRSALERLAPVQIGVGTGSAPVGSNRREAVKDKTADAGGTRIILGRNPAAAIDREVQVLKIARAGDPAPAAILFDYATHSTALGPKNYLVSGDVHGLAEQFVERYLGGDVVAPALAGASGNIDPWFRVRPEFNTKNGWIPEPVLLGTMLGEEVVLVAERVKTAAAGGPVRSAFKAFELPAKPEGGNAEAPARPTRPLAITVGRVGDVAFAGLGCEAFNEIGRAIKSASPFPHTFVITHCNGSAGYLPIESAYAEGGYEVRSSPFAPAAADAAVEETVRLLRELK